MPSLQTGNTPILNLAIPQEKPSEPSAPPKPETAPVKVPSSPNDTLAVATTVNAKENQALTEVQSQLQSTLTLNEFDRIFAGPQLNLKDVQTVLKRSPELAAHIQALPRGAAVLALFQTAATRPLKEAEVLQLQRFLVESTGAQIGYQGHPTGLDGDYGSRTHGALIRFLRQNLAELPAPVANIAPSAALSSARLNQLLAGPKQSLTTVARVVAQLPADSRNRILAKPGGADFLASLEKAAQTPLNKSEVQALQGFLVKQGADLRYPGHATGIDGQYGKQTFQALRQFLSQSLVPQKEGPVASVKPTEPSTVSPTAAPTTAPTQAPADGPYPRYDRMLEDNLLDMTLALGYDEGAPGYAKAHLSEEIRLTREIESRGFVRDDAKAMALLKQAGKEIQGEYSAFYLKENIATSNGKPVHSIVRVITSGDGQKGTQKRQAALEGMKQSDVFMYGGHARYGTGPDFDANFSVTIDWEGVPNAKGQGKVTYHDDAELKALLSPKGLDSEATEALKKLQKLGKVQIDGQNSGNLRIGTDNKHPHEFGSFLMHEALKNTSSQTLAEDIQGEQYRLWLFNGCRTQDYQTPIREMGKHNPALNTENLDLIMTNQTLWWENTAGSLIAFLDGVSAFEKTADLNARLQAANPDQGMNGKTHVRQGFDDNPLHAPWKPD